MNVDYIEASKSNREKGRFSNSEIEKILQNMKAVEATLNNVLGGNTLVGACKEFGIENQFKFRQCLSNLSAFMSETDRTHNSRAYDMQVLATPTERLYSDVFGIPDSTSEIMMYLPIDANETIDYILKNREEYGLTDREAKVIRMYYFEDGATLESVGKELGVTRERVRQVIAKALRKLRHPVRAKLLKTGIKETRELEAAYNAIRESEIEMLVEARKERMVEERLRAEKQLEEERKEYMPIEELNLSVRSYNCLKRAGFITLKDLAEVEHISRLQNIRNMGRKSLNEIVEAVREYYPDYLRG